MQLDTATPREIDTRAAELDGHYATLRALVAKNLDTIHTSVERRPLRTGRGSRKEWNLTPAEAVDAARAMVERGVKPGELNPARALAALAEVEAELRDNLAEANAIEAEYARRPWTRFVSVAGGHVHSGIWCAGGTIRPDTVRNWAPQLSGLAVAEAVAQLGPLLCTHCFPSAPVEWKAGAKTEAEYCDGSGRSPVRGTFRPRGATGWGACPSCKAKPVTTTRGVLRKHKPEA